MSETLTPDTIGAVAGPQPRWRLKEGLHSIGILLSFAVLVAAIEAFDPAFLSKANIFNMFGQWAVTGIMAVGMTFVTIGRGFDLSIASGFSLCAIVAAILGAAGYPLSVAFLGALLAGLLIGCINGTLVTVMGINAFIATVGTGFIMLGVDFLLTPNTYIEVKQSSFDWLGAGTWHSFSYKGIVMLLIFIVGEIVLLKTVYGVQLFAVGSNPEASRLTGLPTRRVLWVTYLISGGCVGIAGALAASQLNSAQARMEPTIVFDVIAVVVVGGTSLAGGEGAIWRTAVGLGIIAAISNGFTLVDLNPFYQGLVKGVIIILALAGDGWIRRIRVPYRTKR